jgi:hypothetical protein
LKNSRYDLFRFYSSLCICLVPLRSGQDTAITGLDRYGMYAGVGSRRLGRLLCSNGFRFLSTLKPVRNSSARFGRILARKDGAIYVRCTLRMRFCAAYISSFKALFSVLCYIILSFGRIWVSMDVVRHPASYPTGIRDSFPGGKAAGV